MTTGDRVQDRNTGATGTLLNDGSRPVAIVKFDQMAYETWSEWRDLA